MLNQRLTGPGTAVVLAAGIYLATDSHQWDEPVYRRYMRAEVFLGVVVLVAIFFMAAKPGG